MSQRFRSAQSVVRPLASEILLDEERIELSAHYETSRWIAFAKSIHGGHAIMLKVVT